MRFRLGLLALACFASPQSSRAELRVATPSVQLGEARGGMPLKHVFAFANAGAAPLEIIEVERGCGCLAPRLDRKLLLPGERGNLTIEVRTLGHKEGAHTWNARIRYKMGELQRETSVAIHVMIKNEVAVEPPALALFLETTLTQHVTITDRRGTPLSIQRVSTTHRDLSARLIESSGGTHKILVEASGATLAPGRYDEMLDIYTNDPEYRHLQVPITLVRLGRAPVLVTPEKAVFHLDAGKPPAPVVIRLRPRDGKSVEIEKVVTEDLALKCTWSSHPEFGGTVRIQADPARWTTRPIQSGVRVYLRDRAEPVLVPVEAIGP